MILRQGPKYPVFPTLYLSMYAKKGLNIFFIFISATESWMGYIGNVVSSVPSYLPSQVTDTLLQERAFATVHHNLSGKKNICALAM